MMTAQAEKIAEKASSDKAGATVGKALEKLGEKRRALGRGLESLLRPPQQATGGLTGDSVPGPRVVTPGESQFPVSSSQFPDKTFEPRGAQGSTEAYTRTAYPVPDIKQSVEALSDPQASRESRAFSGTIAELQAAAESAPQSIDGSPAVEIPLDEIDANPYQTRSHWDERLLDELAASIRMQGVIQPIVVRPASPPYQNAENGTPLRYLLVLGERRLLASRRAGKTTIPAVVKRVSDQQAAEMTLVENLQRQDLNCMDQAAAFKKLSENFRLTQEEIGKRVGVSRETVSNYMRLLRLPERAAGYLNEGRLSYSHARQLLVIEDNLMLERMAEKAVKDKLSVQQLEELIAEKFNLPMTRADVGDKKTGGARWVDPNVRAQQRNLESALGMKVRIRDRKGKGTIRIEYSSLDDFDRLVGLLKGKKQ